MNPAVSPPSNRISASATMPIVRAELVVVEADPAEAVRADDHAEAEEQDEAGHAHAHRDERREQARREQRRADQDELAVLHAAPTMPGLQRERGVKCRADRARRGI
jgi:hypothetical protein